MKTKFSNFVKNMKIKKETLKVAMKKKKEERKQKKKLKLKEQEKELYSTEFSREFGDLESETEYNSGDDYTEQVIAFVPKYVISDSDDELNDIFTDYELNYPNNG